VPQHKGDLPADTVGADQSRPVADQRCRCGVIPEAGRRRAL